MGARRDQRGVVLPSPVMMLSIVAVVMAGVAFFATRGGEPSEREIAPVAQPKASTSPTANPTPSATAAPTKKPRPIVRKKVMVEVFNNTSTKGLAAEASEKASTLGWQVVGADNWYGSVPSTTVYYPTKLKREGRQLALDLGVKRTAKAVDPMKLDRLTIILTAPLH
jgi:LytR cell envelope-related transcriptional attenuator